jgi:hypothetical protein
MGFIGFVMAIVAGFFTLIALVPFLGWLNWFIVPFALIALIVNLISAVRVSGRVFGIIGVAICTCALGLSIFRLVTGFGLL